MFVLGFLHVLAGTGKIMIVESGIRARTLVST